MWFNKKDKPEEPVERATPRRRTGDMRSELGLNTEAQPRATRRVGSNTTVTQDNAYNEEVLLNDLKVRARRRFIGALVLLAAAFVILPWVFDDNRKQAAPVVSVVVPEQKIQFEVQNPRAAAEVTPVADTTKPAEPVKPKVEEKPAEKVAEKPAEPVKAAKYVVHIGVVSSKAELDALNKRLSAKGAKASTETVETDGVSKTRVRLGPFDSQAAAQAAADKVKGAAKNPVVIEIK